MKNYLLLLFLIGFLSSQAQQTYYDDVDLTLTGVALKAELATKITNTHTNFLSYTPGIWEASRITDEDANNTDNVILLYGWEDGSDSDVTNDISRSKTSNGGNVGDWNREHSYPQSLGNPPLGTEGPGADAHHLRPTDVQRNGTRANRPFADGSGNSGTVGANWYPGDEWKGDVARMMMFMYVRYGDRCLPSAVGIGDNSNTPDDMIDLFLEWNAEDPVSSLEDNRNNYHESNGTYAQGNRNPFIDNPYLATLIWGGPNAEDRWGIFNTDTEAPSVPMGLSVSNETSNSIDLSWTASTDNTAVTGYDVFVNSAFNKTVTGTSTTITGLDPETTYSFTVLAKDAAGNESAQSTAVNGTTLAGGTGGTDCATETFSNIGAASSSYSERTWTGDDGGEWTATDARTDQTLTGSAITIRDGELTSSSISGGIGSLTVTTLRAFSGGTGTFNLRVNGTTVGTIPYSDVQETTTINNIDITGNIIVSFTDKTTTSDRVIIDDLSWNCYDPALGIDDLNLEKLITLYPNPSSDGSITINLANIAGAETNIYDITGKLIFSKKNLLENTQISNLPQGMLLVEIISAERSVTKKVLIQ
ncbi:endonuclease [Aquimarina litoralis]|uniref:endonuclease n=1 Tax=Aquimarina litoralis TaxID=584605 RepID=UPI001C560F31|nr:endonuclease [Aquimarina litoralis]MBW1295723.1 T9SS type A sorting domain-containing protein [Aquimarina litoralis]